MGKITNLNAYSHQRRMETYHSQQINWLKIIDRALKRKVLSQEDYGYLLSLVDSLEKDNDDQEYNINKEYFRLKTTKDGY